MLLGFVAAGWFPRSCPVLRGLISRCPNTEVANSISPEQADIDRVPHQIIGRDLINFKIQAQDFRKTTEVRFPYRGDLTKQSAYIAIVTPTGVRELALVTNPLLVDLTWARYTSTLPLESLFQRQETYATIADLRANLPAANKFAVDRVIAKSWKLTSDQYTPLESLTSLDGIDYIATSYAPSDHDGGWFRYAQTFDISDALVDSKNQIEFRISVPNVTSGKTPFLMGNVNVDYKSMQ